MKLLLETLLRHLREEEEDEDEKDKPGKPGGPSSAGTRDTAARGLPADDGADDEPEEDPLDDPALDAGDDPDEPVTPPEDDPELDLLTPYKTDGYGKVGRTHRPTDRDPADPNAKPIWRPKFYTNPAEAISVAMERGANIIFRYDGHWRDVEPFTLGERKTTGNPTLRGWHYRGFSKSMMYPAWRTFLLSKMENVYVVKHKIPRMKRAGYRQPDKHMSRIDKDMTQFWKEAAQTLGIVL